MVQRRAARFAKFDYRRTTSVSILMVDLGWRTLLERRKDVRSSLTPGWQGCVWQSSNISRQTQTTY